MAISAKKIREFNACKLPCYNEEYNKANGLPSMKEYGLMSRVRQDKHGIFNEPITAADIAKYVRIHGE